MDDSVLFSIDTRPDQAVKRQLSSKKDKAQARRKREQALAEREAMLATLVFQDKSLVDALGEEPEVPPKRSKPHGSTPTPAAVPDDDAGDDDDDDDGDEEAGKEADGVEEEADEKAPAARAAWEDEDDAQLSVDVMKQKKLRKLRKTKAEGRLAGAEYEERLRAQFRSSQRNVGWAESAAAEVARADAQGGPTDKAAALLRSAAPLLASGAGRGPLGPLGTGKLSIKRLGDLNGAARSHSCVNAIQWHPNAQLALTAGLDKVVHLFRVDGEENPQMQAVHVPRMQIRSAAFAHDGAQVLVCGEKSKVWGAFDLHHGQMHLLPGVMGRDEAGYKRVLPSPDGKHLVLLGASGSLLLLSALTKQLVATLQPGGGGWGCQCAEFSPAGDVLYASGQGGLVQVWDVARRCCVHTWHDRGGLRTSALAASADGATVATGSDSGAVCTYSTREVLQSDRPEPRKEFLNLQQPISSLAFNAQGEALAFASKYDRGAMRVAHVGGAHVFANWPTAATPLGKVECCAFSPHSGFLAAGNDKGKVLLWRLNHYPTA